MEALYKLMTSHRSIRKYKNKPVKEEHLKKILETAIHAPSSVNGQQFSVIVVKDDEKKKKIAEMTGGQPWIAQAPVFLVFVADFYRISKSLEKIDTPFGNMKSVEATMVGSVDCGIAFSNAMNMAESMGYGIVPIGAVRRKPYDLIELLDLPSYVYPVLGMCIGHPDEEPMKKPRFPYNVMIHEETYNKNVDSAVEDFDKTILAYMEARSEGEDAHSWTDRMKYVYGQVYFPEVNGSLKKQGYKNEK